MTTVYILKRKSEGIMPAHKRSFMSIFLLKPSLQFRYVSVIFVAILTTCIIMGFHFHFAVTEKITRSLGYTELRQVLIETNIIMVCLFVSYSLIVLVFAILISHKFVGPLYRFEKTFECIGQGNLAVDINLRSGDELIDMKKNISAMILQLKQLIEQDRSRAREAAQEAETIAALLENLHQPPCDETAHKLKALAGNLRQITSNFTI
jgi:methyl-accepting chemotaxis protein